MTIYSVEAITDVEVAKLYNLEFEDECDDLAEMIDALNER